LESGYHDRGSGRALLTAPAVGDVGTLGLLADRVEVELAQAAANLVELVPAGHAGLDPRRQRRAFRGRGREGEGVSPTAGSQRICKLYCCFLLGDEGIAEGSSLSHEWPSLLLLLPCALSSPSPARKSSSVGPLASRSLSDGDVFAVDGDVAFVVINRTKQKTGQGEGGERSPQTYRATTRRGPPTRQTRRCETTWSTSTSFARGRTELKWWNSCCELVLRE